MVQDHYIYVVWSTCREDELTNEGVAWCKCYPTDLCGVYEDLDEAKQSAQECNTDWDDNIIPFVNPWHGGFWDGRIEAKGFHDDFVIQRTFFHPRGYPNG